MFSVKFDIIEISTRIQISIFAISVVIAKIEGMTQVAQFMKSEIINEN